MATTPTHYEVGRWRSTPAAPHLHDDVSVRNNKGNCSNKVLLVKRYTNKAIYYYHKKSSVFTVTAFILTSLMSQKEVTPYFHICGILYMVQAEAHCVPAF